MRTHLHIQAAKFECQFTQSVILPLSAGCLPSCQEQMYLTRSKNLLNFDLVTINIFVVAECLAEAEENEFRCFRFLVHFVGRSLLDLHVESSICEHSLGVQSMMDDCG